VTTTATIAEDIDPTEGIAAPGAGAAPEEAREAGSPSRADGAVDPARVRLFRGPQGVLRCTLEGDRTVLRAKVVRVFPLSRGSTWVNVLDGKNKEVCLIEDAALLDAESRRLVAEELQAQYRVATITRIRSVRNEYRTLYWDVETDLGRRDFVLKWAADSILWLGPAELLLVDVDTNRFHIPDFTRLDAASRKEMEILL
jgi:hypothetical protein